MNNIIIIAFLISVALATFNLIKLISHHVFAFIKGAHVRLERLDLGIDQRTFMVIFLLFMVLLGWLGTHLLDNLAGWALGFLLFPAVSWVSSLLEKKRARLFETQLVDALFISANSLKAGFSLLQAFEMVVREMRSPIKNEFEKVVRDVRLGLTIDEALGKMKERVDSQELELLKTAVDIHMEMGGNIAELFENIAHVIKERMRIQGQIKTTTSQGRLTGIVILILPLFLWIIINALDPGYFTPLYREPLGIKMLILAVIMEVLGIVMIKRICTIDF
jgi:tight adherence protein B